MLETILFFVALYIAMDLVNSLAGDDDSQYVEETDEDFDEDKDLSDED